MNYEVIYYKRLDAKWLKGRVRNLTLTEAYCYSAQLSELFDTKIVRIRQASCITVQH